MRLHGVACARSGLSARQPRSQATDSPQWNHSSDALEALDPPRGTAPLARLAREPLRARRRAAARLAGWLLVERPLTPGPTASIMYGAAGIAVGLLHVAALRDDAQLLAVSDLWARRAARDGLRDDGFYNANIQITPDVVGRASPFHAMSGVACSLRAGRSGTSRPAVAGRGGSGVRHLHERWREWPRRDRGPRLASRSEPR